MIGITLTAINRVQLLIILIYANIKESMRFQDHERTHDEKRDEFPEGTIVE